MADVPNGQPKKKGVKKMATQLQATPTVYGEEARKILASAKNPPTQKALDNAKKLLASFEQIEKRGFKW